MAICLFEPAAAKSRGCCGVSGVRGGGMISRMGSVAVEEVAGIHLFVYIGQFGCIAIGQNSLR